MKDEFDYIVVGSGAGGAPVAARLAQAGYEVLLLEAGEAPDSYEYRVPAFHTLASEDEEMAWEFFVRHYDDQARQERDSKFESDEKPIFYPRAGTLGGCTAHNAMILVYPNNSDWAEIAKLTGDDSWKPESMRRYFQRFEDCRHRPWWRRLHKWTRINPGRHGWKGWLSTQEADPKLLFKDEDLLEIIKSSAFWTFFTGGRWLKRIKLFFAAAADPNDWRSVSKRAAGIRQVPLTTRNGRRAGPRDLLRSVQKDHPDKLTIRTGALAARVLFEGRENRAVGVEYLEGKHLYRADPRSGGSVEDPSRHKMTATREVILAGGAFNTPQLLQLSGIGPADLLQDNEIELLAELPGVGANLQDRYEVSVVHRMKKPFELLKEATMRPPGPGQEPDPFLKQWIEDGSGIYATNGALLSIIRRSKSEQIDPDVFIFGLVTDFRGYYRSYSTRVSNSHDKFTWAILKGSTNNTKGTVRIRSKDPREMPDIRFRYFDEGDGSPHDLKAMVEAVEFVRSLAKHYEEEIERELVPGPEVQGPDQLARFIEDEAWGHHASCTCKIGHRDDPMAVLDGDFRVRKTRGLRVVDASIFPRIPGLFIVSAIYMAAEKAAEVIVADAKRGEP